MVNVDYQCNIFLNMRTPLDLTGVESVRVTTKPFMIAHKRMAELFNAIREDGHHATLSQATGTIAISNAKGALANDSRTHIALLMILDSIQVEMVLIRDVPEQGMKTHELVDLAA